VSLQIPVNFAGFQTLMKMHDLYIFGKLGWCTSSLYHPFSLWISMVWEIRSWKIRCSSWTQWISKIECIIMMPLLRGLQPTQDLSK
jgi:hypothetical protein